MTDPDQRSFLDKPSSPLIVNAIAYSLALVAAIVAGRQVEGSPLLVAFVGTLAATLVIFIGATLLKNTSLYDPYWSLQPPALAIFWIYSTETFGDPMRAGLVLFFTCFWSFRLTFNCFRRWKSMRQEDFRYTDYRQKLGKLYPLVDFFGMMLMPTVLVFLGSLPIYYVMTSGGGSTPLDAIAIVVTATAITFEVVADEQLHKFLLSNKGSDRVLRTGLWSWSRHPNYFGEVLFWWGLYLFALGTSTDLWWTGLGALLITLLFAFISVPMMQARKRERRPTYEQQVRDIPVLVPRLWRRGSR
ncbi:MAG: DUF1295 domain-containing protein [Alphaproteobacteria bacterium]|nr:MAG: DUF1295 domain-containing protein [Alphaproteobacteria bacterium]